jgi:hypothetical protein
MEQLLVLNENQNATSNKKNTNCKLMWNKVATKNNTIATSTYAQFATSVIGQLQLL